MKEGNEDVIRLHDKLYTGVLAKFLRKDLGYTPHIGLGLFVSKNKDYNVANPTLQTLDETKYKNALRETELLNLDYWTDLDNLELITLNNDVIKVLSR